MEPLKNSKPPRFDINRIKEFAETPAEQKEFIELYLVETKRQLDELEAAVDEGKPALVHRVAHTAAGASATCGMETMIPLFRALENCGFEGKLDDVPLRLAETKTAFTQLEAFLRQYLLTLS